MPETTRADTMSVRFWNENPRFKRTKQTLQGFLGSFYEDVTIHVRNCTPQPSSGGCLSLLVTGLMSRKVHFHKSTVLIVSVLASF